MTVVSQLGFDLSGAALLWIALLAGAGLLAIIYIPRRSVPIDPGLSVEDRAKLIAMRSSVRQNVTTVVGGLAAVISLIITLQQLRRDNDSFHQKKAELFASSLKTIMSAASPEESRAEAMYVLSYVARSDATYHRLVFDAVSTFVREQSARACANNVYRGPNYHVDRTIQIAMTIIGQRQLTDDIKGKRLNLEHACFADVDLNDEKGVVTGLASARMSGSRMLRIDFTRVQMPNSELMGIEAGDYQSPGWDENIGRSLHKGADGDDRKGTDNGDLRRKYIAHFIEADLTNARFSGAGLQGVDFAGATLTNATFDNASLSRANFRGAAGLSPKQFESACVGKTDWSADVIKLEQPYFDKSFREKLLKHPGLEKGLPACTERQVTP